MTETLKRQFIFCMMLLVMAMQMTIGRMPSAFAAGLDQVVINEVAWAGSPDGANDEWIELYNAGSEEVDLTDWYIEDDGATRYEIASGVIKAHGYFLIEDKEEVVNNLAADAVIGLSLANTGDSLVLKDSEDNVVDEVNAGGGAWYAGGGDNKESMERKDPAGGDVAENWSASTADTVGVGRNGAKIWGTPDRANSNFAGGGPEVKITMEDEVADTGEMVTFSVGVSDGEDIFSYGFDLVYDPAVMKFVEVKEGEFLKSDGEDTSFFGGLENGKEGKLVVGDARLLNPPEGVDGDGELLEVSFEIVGASGKEGGLSFGGGSFVSNSEGGAGLNMRDAEFVVGGVAALPVAAVSPVKSLKVEAGEERYSLSLKWSKPDGEADGYIILKQNAVGEFVKIGETGELIFTDGENLVAGVDYHYRVIAVKGAGQSNVVEGTGKEVRGLAGDGNRSDRVDGADIEALARAYGSIYGEADYKILVDNNYDGKIDGSDLINIGVNFALTF